MENRLLSLELPLAKKSVLYAVFHLPARSIQIKIRGEVLREFKILSVETHHPWDPPVQKRTVEHCGISNTPDRVIINPPKKDGKEDEEADTGTIVEEKLDDSFEIDDMPDFYSLELDDGSLLLVLPRTESHLRIGERVSNAFVKAAFFAKRLRAFRSPSATIILEPQDARSLYWALLNAPPILLSA